MALSAAAQSVAPVSPDEPPIVESGYINPERYTNAFFGFSIPLPKGVAFHDMALPTFGGRHLIFGLQSQRDPKAFLTVIAIESSNPSSNEAKKTAAGPKNQETKRAEIGGKEFWNAESVDSMPMGSIRTIRYVTALDGWVVEFSIVSFDAKLAQQLQRSLESITFFDRARASEMAGPGSHSYLPGAGVGATATSRVAQLGRGVRSGDKYTHAELGVAYQYPRGWTVADRAVQQRIINMGRQPALGSNNQNQTEDTAQRCSRLLLMVTQYPDGAPVAGVNSTVAMIAIDPACIPDFTFPGSVQDDKGIKAAAKQIARAFSQSPFVSRGENSVKAFTVQGHVMLEISGSTSFNVPGQREPMSILTSFLLTQSNNYLVAWSFISGSEAGLAEMKNTNVQLNLPGSTGKTQ